MSGMFDGEALSIALCWRLERSDGAGIALTSHDRPLTVDGALHEPSPGVVPAAVARTLGLEPHSSEIGGALDAGSLTPQDLALGRWDNARAALRAVDWNDDAAPPVKLIAGEIGNVALNGDGFSAELRGAAIKLASPACPSTSPECRAEFGDKRCQVDLAGRTIAARVVEAEAGNLTLDVVVDERFLLGRLRYRTGENCGVSTAIIAVDGATVTLRDVSRAPVLPGCRVEIREGCDKQFQTCSERFANGINFRGEPHLPGNDLLTRYPGV